MKILVACAQVFLGIIYFFMKLCPVEDKVVMISRQANRPSLDFTLIRRHLLKQAPQIKIVTLCHTLEKRLNAKYIDLIKYGFHMLKQMYHIAHKQSGCAGHLLYRCFLIKAPEKSADHTDMALHGQHEKVVGLHCS